MKKLLKRTLWTFSLLLAMVVVFLGWHLGLEAYRFLSDDPAVWEAVIAEFEQQDMTSRPKPGQVLFIGSSSIRLWSSLTTDLEPIPAFGRGFGGAKINDVQYFADRLISPYAPGAIVLYIGSNDLSGNFGSDFISNEEAEKRYRSLLSTIGELAPEATLYLVALKPTTSAWDSWPRIQQFNRFLETLAGSRDQWRYINANDGLWNEEGRPREDLLFFDGIHLNARGYTIWGQAIRQALMIDMLAPAAHGSRF